jgi:restriction endonuclease Mrr
MDNKMKSLIEEMRGNPIISNETKNTQSLIGTPIENEVYKTNKYKDLVNKMHTDNSITIESENKSSVNLSEEEMNRIRETIVKEKLEKLKEEDPAQYYRILAGIEKKTTSKKYKRKHKKKCT